MSTKLRPSDLVPAGFIAERITHIDDETCILLSRAGAPAACPACGRMSRTVRSRYCRQVADLPLSARRVRLLVQRRRFACDAVLCGRQIFAERFGEVLPPYARRTRGDQAGNVVSGNSAAATIRNSVNMHAIDGHEILHALLGTSASQHLPPRRS
nr:transposase family protein [Rhizobium tibeticum]